MVVFADVDNAGFGLMARWLRRDTDCFFVPELVATLEAATVPELLLPRSFFPSMVDASVGVPGVDNDAESGLSLRLHTLLLLPVLGGIVAKP